MENTQCWWCKAECVTCSSCRGIWAQMADCQSCSGTGYQCPNGDENWEGSWIGLFADTDEIFQWIVDHRSDDPEALTRADIPYEDPEELGYLAFAANTMGNRELGFDENGLRRRRWYMHCLELAIESGGEKPEIMRLPLYSEILKQRPQR